MMLTTPKQDPIGGPESVPTELAKWIRTSIVASVRQRSDHSAPPSLLPDPPGETALEAPAGHLTAA